MDRLASIFDRLSLRANVFNTGPLCGSSYHYKAEEGVGHIHVLKQGALTLEMPGSKPEIICAPYMMFYLKPMTHRIRPLADAGDTVTICGQIDFGGGLENPIASVLPAYIPVNLNQHKELSGILKLLFEEAFNPVCGRQAALDRICELMIIHLLRINLQKKGAGIGLLAGLSDPKLSRALTGIHDEPTKPWSLEMLAERAGMSRASFAVKFRDTVGITPGDYLNQWRLGLAKSLLKENKSVSWVASEIGYSSPAAFTRAFINRYDQTPSVWLKSLA